MGLLSSSRSTSNVNYSTTSNTTNEDSRQAAGDNSLVVRLDGEGASFNHSSTSTINNMDQRVTNNYSNDAATITAAAGALSSASSTVSGTLPFLKSVTDGAFNAARDLGDQLASGYAKFSSDTLSMYNAGNARATAAEQAAYAFSRSSLDNTLNFADTALSTSRNQSDTALAAIRSTTESLLGYITQSEKDPNERAFSQVVPWLVGGAVIIGVFAFGSRSK